MLTIQSFLLKFRNRTFNKELKKNVKYAMLIFTYAFVALLIIFKCDALKVKRESKVLEAFAAQTITLRPEETHVLNEVDYLSQVLGSTSNLEHNSITKATKLSNPAFYIGNMRSADVYIGDLASVPTDSKKVNQVKKDKPSESATKKKEAEEAKETMNRGIAALSLSSKEIKILERIVEAEATGEDIKGKILVANVIMNRVNDKAFPDSVEKVVFQKTGGTYQFSPISDQRYYSVEVSDSTHEAVQRVLQGEDYSQGALYFSARKRASASNMKWFDSHLQWLFQYGGHEFFKHK